MFLSFVKSLSSAKLIKIGVINEYSVGENGMRVAKHAVCDIKRYIRKGFYNRPNVKFLIAASPWIVFYKFEVVYLYGSMIFTNSIFKHQVPQAWNKADLEFER